MIEFHKLDPLFVCGIGRSGTSALLRALATHKNVVPNMALGEAPFINHFADFLVQFEGENQENGYHMASYKLAENARERLFRQMLARLHIGSDFDAKASDSIKFWSAKCFPRANAKERLLKLYPDARFFYIIRNGVEVVASAMRYKGFQHLSFERLCSRWSRSFAEFEHFERDESAVVIRHEELTADPAAVLKKAYKKLGMEGCDRPAEFLLGNRVNSSYSDADTTSLDQKWNQFNTEQKAKFVELCGPMMEEYQFQMPGTGDAGRNSFRHQHAIPKPTEKVEPGKVLPTINANMPWAGFNYSCHPSDRAGYLYMESPKVACSTLKFWLQSHEYILMGEEPREFDPPTVHKPGLSPLPRAKRNEEELFELLVNDNERFSFAFVRNPFGRVLSCFRSKIERNIEPKRKILAIINGTSVDDVKDLTQEVSFHEFLEVVSGQTLREMDPHWRPLNSQLLTDVIPYDFIGRLETLQSDIRILESRLFGDTKVALPKIFNRTDSDHLLDEYYDLAAENKVREIYEADFRVFGYAMELDSLKEA